jgi:hypothetical protein
MHHLPAGREEAEMIFEAQKTIFIHYPKTGGNSIQDALRKYSADQIVTFGKHQDGIERFGVRNAKFKNLVKHSNLNDYYEALGQDIYMYKIFITTRNPFDRLVSYYFSPHRGGVIFDRNNFSKFIDKIPSLENYIFIKKNIFEKAEIYRGIKILKFENISEDFSKFCNEIGINGITLPHRNASVRSEYKSYYDDELIEKVKKIHKFEISIGNYKF